MVFKDIFNNEVSVISIIVTITAIANIIAGLEWLSLYKSFKDDGVFSWSVKKTSSKVFAKSEILNYLFKYPNILYLILFEILISAVIPFVTDNRFLLCVCCLVLSTCLILFSIRNDSRFSGADQMNKVVFITFAISLISPSNWVWKIGILFIFSQTIIAYCTPGFLRIFETSWHNSSALTNILKLNTFSRSIAWRFTKQNPRLVKWVSVGLIIFECSFIIAWLLPFNYLLIFLTLGIIFHLMNAVIMGLNHFPASFVATYPAYIWTSIYLKQHIL